MRTESEMLNLIVGTARNDKRIRAVIMNGSRANPAAPRDIFQDFDIVYLVTEIESFKHDPAWIDVFGDRMILQLPDLMEAEPPEDSFGYLMQFMDGNRIDLRLCLAQPGRDSQSILLLDKDKRIVPFDEPDDHDYLPVPPTAKEFADCCNEFWWVSTYIAKGLWRDQLIYAKYMFDQVVRPQLMTMLTWYVGMKTSYDYNTGSYGKWLRQLLEPELWTMLEKTYSDANYEHTWEALFVMGDLFRRTALEVAAALPGLAYPHRDDERVSAHLRYVQRLPKNATDMY